MVSADKSINRSQVSNTQQNENVRILSLNDKENLETSLFKFEIGWTLRFVKGPSLFGKNVKIFTNIPSTTNHEFSRENYTLLPWSYEDSKYDDTSLYAETIFLFSGSFHYYFLIEGLNGFRGSGYLLVNPILSVGLDEERLPLDAIQCQSVLTKLLGPLNEWEDRLAVAKKSGYNMIHFTPVQALGKSNSCYSLLDQHCLNPIFNSIDKDVTFDDLTDFINKLNKEWKVLSVTDIVLNHTSNETKWILEHPDSTYNLMNSPHLRPAYLLDKVIHFFSCEIGDGKWEDSGLPSKITTESHLNAIKSILKDKFLVKAKIHEFYTINLDQCMEELRRFIEGENFKVDSSFECTNDLVIQDPTYRRNASTINLRNTISSIKKLCPCIDIRNSKEEFLSKAEEHLKLLNQKIIDSVNSHLNAAIENVIHSVRYERLQSDGPKITEVTAKHPLVPPYFTHPVKSNCLADEENIIWSDQSKFIQAHNGWVMNDDPLRNFVDEDCNVFLRRELIAWGDSVKLRYGKKPQDSPFLWQYMKKYVEQMAQIFHGIRLDNCHSTPIEVAEYLLDAARKVRPNLYVFAELFTSNEFTDNIFVNRLGINSLIRESMSAHNSHELGRLVHRYGGNPVGSFSQMNVKPISHGIAHALFFDLTHDNPSPVQKRSVYDMLPSSALVLMASCASGSNRGYDELVPYHIHVVNESRLYGSWKSEKIRSSEVNESSGIIKAKRALNDLHTYLGTNGYSEVYVDQVTHDIVAVTRHCPSTHTSVILVAHTAFTSPSENYSQPPPLCVPGNIEEILMEACLMQVKESDQNSDSKCFIEGLSGYSLSMNKNIPLNKSRMIKAKDNEDAITTEIDFVCFPPGSVIALRVSLDKRSTTAIEKVKEYLMEINNNASSKFVSLASHLTLAAMNIILFRCDNEEKDDGNGYGVYNIPNHGSLPYCGLQGIISVLSIVRQNNDLGHPLCENLRSGDWLPEYTYKRLLLHPSTKELGEWLQNVLDLLKCIPRYLIPYYFDGIITSVYSAMLNHTWSLMSSFVTNGTAFVKSLALGSVQLGGSIKSSPLPCLSPKIVGVDSLNNHITLSAGLPHFCVGFMRNWGRDTFISLRGLFLLTGRHLEARFMILAYAGCLRHGLIPNLLNKGHEARFNCRDAVWWWLQCIQDYYDIVPAGHTILKDQVSRIFPDDDSEPKGPGDFDQPLYDVIQESLQRHVYGVKYRERNAGFSLDAEMSYEGFDNEIGVDQETGFVFGGSEHNCGTWMDKMGRSELCGTKGKPATPRDGSAIEIVGLCKSTLRWLNKMFKLGFYPYDCVKKIYNGQEMEWKFIEWEGLIQKSFEKYFWIDPVSDGINESKKDLINQRGIYKDSFNASQFWADFQFRPNFTVAMVVAPELFDIQHAWACIQLCEKILLGPLGMKTLDPSDWAYDGNYNNCDNSNNKKIAGGYNYHQGPEWLWPVGFFCRAKLIFSNLLGNETSLMEAADGIRSILSEHYKAIQQSPWHGLPELTNENGQICQDSCPIQAWSHACLLEVLYDLKKVSS